MLSPHITIFTRQTEGLEGSPQLGLALGVHHTRDFLVEEIGTLAMVQVVAAFQVQDQGIGIPEADRARLYEAFYRGTNVGNIANVSASIKGFIKSCPIGFWNANALILNLECGHYLYHRQCSNLLHQKISRVMHS